MLIHRSSPNDVIGTPGHKGKQYQDTEVLLTKVSVQKQAISTRYITKISNINKIKTSVIEWP